MFPHWIISLLHSALCRNTSVLSPDEVAFSNETLAFCIWLRFELLYILSCVLQRIYDVCFAT